MRDPANLPALLQSFFTTRLTMQRKASSHTIASYRDTFRLLLQFAQTRLRRAPSQLELNHLDATLIGAFLEDLEKRRRNGAKSRNLRLTAIRSFFRYASLKAPAQSGVIQRVLFPTKSSHVPWWVFSRGQRSKRCWRRRIEQLGWDAVTMLFCSLRFKPACDCPR
jgi:site-specific recombinase XerD